MFTTTRNPYSFDETSGGCRLAFASTEDKECNSHIRKVKILKT